MVQEDAHLAQQIADTVQQTVLASVTPALLDIPSKLIKHAKSAAT
jgi:vacuolar-type H+-ATPase subunit F/Vma7